MNNRTLTALNGSIKKWRDIIEGRGEDNGTENCPLCKVFYKDNCDGCPVAELTGRTGCSGTPYDVVGAMGRGEDEYQDAAKEELAFLVQLLPEDTPAL